MIETILTVLLTYVIIGWIINIIAGKKIIP